MFEKVQQHNAEAVAIARAILVAKPQVLEQDKQFWLALRVACKRQDLQALKDLLEQAETRLESVA